MVRSLRRLQDTAQDVARKRLPELVKQMSEAEPQDVDTSVESVGVHSRDEIGQVASAFDDVHREAVRLAGEQALLRGNVNAMFTNLSRRSQGLIQRQLSLISELESREADPDQLSSLFKLDHLATRMRRNGENLLVLAGEEPGRRWTRPVPLVDVLRAAASEVEQYERIELNSVPATEVAGRVVNDLVHLLAELLENATSFSSPQTKVKVTGHALPDGRVLVEIHDTGIGLSPEDLAAINERLASPPTVDVSVSRRMGLFVVGRLSLRHGIRIQLRPSDSGGTTALVMLPDRRRTGRRPGPAAARQGQARGRQLRRQRPAGLPKGAGLAAALQRGPSGGPGGGAGAASSARRPRPPGRRRRGPSRAAGSGSPVGAGSGPGDGGAPTTNFFTDNGPGRRDRRPPAPPGQPPGSAAAAAFRPGRAAAGRCRVRRQGRSRGHGGFARPVEWGNRPRASTPARSPAAGGQRTSIPRPQPLRTRPVPASAAPSDSGEFPRPQSLRTGQFARPPATDTSVFQRPPTGGPETRASSPVPTTGASPELASWAPHRRRPSRSRRQRVAGHRRVRPSRLHRRLQRRPGAAPEPRPRPRTPACSSSPGSATCPPYDPDFGIPTGPPVVGRRPDADLRVDRVQLVPYRLLAPPPAPGGPPEAMPEPAQPSHHAPAPRPAAYRPPPCRPFRGGRTLASAGGRLAELRSPPRGCPALPTARWPLGCSAQRRDVAPGRAGPSSPQREESPLPGLPRRVPRANLVAGTAQQQSSAPRPVRRSRVHPMTYGAD